MGHSPPSPNPTGGDVSRRGLTQPALHEELMARVVDSANMRRAWKRVKANKGAPGVDGRRIEDFAGFARMHWPQIRQQLVDGIYQPQPVRRVTIPKPQGGERLLALIGRYLRAGVLVGESIHATEIGTPQGGPLSPLLANILLDDLDRELERRGHRFARYADDLVILVKTTRAGDRVKAGVTRFLTRKLALVVNEQKSRVV